MENEFNLQQAFAIDVAVNSNKHLFITGPAGAGKSYTLHLIKDALDSAGKNYMVGAPSGIAAINCGGRTLHSLFQLPFQNYSPEDAALRHPKIYQIFKYTPERITILKALDVLIIDEISMVSCATLDTISTLLKVFREVGEPFGGVRVVLMGDLNQLPPIIKEWNLLKSYYKTPYFFSAKVIRKLIKSKNLFQIELEKIYRQSDKNFIDLLNRCRIGKPTKKDIKKLNKKVNPEFNFDENYTVLCTHNKQAEGINEEIYNKNTNPEFVYKAKVEGRFPKKYGVYDGPVPYELKLKVGLPVIFCANSVPSGDYYNSELGVVSYLDENKVVIKTGNFLKERFIPLKRHDWEAKDFTLVDNVDENGVRQHGKSIQAKTVGRFTQFAIKQSSSISIHKSQGLSLSHVATDISKSFAAGQSYVSLSRCESYDTLVLLKKVKKENIFADPIIEKFSAFKLKKKFMRKYFKKKFGVDWKTKLIEQNGGINK